MVICDGVHRDPTTGKITILGTFSNFAATRYPAQIQFFIYFAVTDGLGPTTLRIQILDAHAGFIDAQNDEDAEGRILAIKTEGNFPSPLAVVESALGIGAEIPNPGTYHCELWAGNELLMSRRFIATLIRDEKEEKQ